MTPLSPIQLRQDTAAVILIIDIIKQILERTNDGRAAAMASGVKFGRKPHSATVSALGLIRQRQSFKTLAEKMGISRATYFRLKRKLKTIHFIDLNQ
ncbi:DNA invertase Pin-like site-specific DNA recombinase [Pantoea alhagi]|uniref:hypothetical protein n=1 Tax=Mixta sp. BE291 TaxID=3158787 RepID=UPI00286106B9|nr:DNA invertase Pin-like site-specific DNA recombinase [Pantoea alhagi]